MKNHPLKNHVAFLGALGVLVVQAVVFAYEVKEDRQVTPQKPVKISASRLSFDRLRGMTTFRGSVKAEHGDVTLTADEIRALSDNRQATAEGHVHVTDPTVPMALSCGVLDYQDRMDLMTAHDDPMLTSLDEDGRPVTIQGRRMELDSKDKVVHIDQDVRIQHEWGKGTAGRATYIAREDKLILEEEPGIQVQSGWLTGRRITSHLGGDRSVLVEGYAEGTFNPDGSPVAPPGTSAPPAAKPTPSATRPPEPSKPGQWHF